MKMKFKRFLSGVMAVATLASVIVQPVAVSASEIEPEPPSFEQQYPELKDVQDLLDSDEIVTASNQICNVPNRRGFPNFNQNARIFLILPDTLLKCPEMI